MFKETSSIPFIVIFFFQSLNLGDVFSDSFFYKMIPYYVESRLSHSGLCLYHHQAYEWFHLISRKRRMWHRDCCDCRCTFCNPRKCNHGLGCQLVDTRPCPNCFGRRCRNIETDNILCHYIFTSYVKRGTKYLSIQYANYTSRLMFIQKYVDRMKVLLKHLDHTVWWKSILRQFMIDIPANSVVVRIDFLQNVTHSGANEVGREFYGKRQTTLFIATCWYREHPNDEVIKAYYEFYSSYLAHNDDSFQRFFGIFMEKFPVPQHTFRFILLSDNAPTHFHNSSNFLWGTRFSTAFGYDLEWYFDPVYHGKGACDARGACVKRALRFYVLEPGHDIHDVGQLTGFTNTVLHEDADTAGHAINVIFDEFDGYDHVPTLPGNTKWYAFRFTDEEYVLYVRKWPCFCVHCLAHEYDRCGNDNICGPWMRKVLKPSDTWKPSATTPVERARQYQRIGLIASQDSDASDYEVEAILAKRTTLDTTEYLVKWRGWDETYNEWLAERDLNDSTNLLRNFNRRVQYI